MIERIATRKSEEKQTDTRNLAEDEAVLTRTYN